MRKRKFAFEINWPLADQVQHSAVSNSVTHKHMWQLSALMMSWLYSKLKGDHYVYLILNALVYLILATYFENRANYFKINSVHCTLTSGVAFGWHADKFTDWFVSWLSLAVQLSNFVTDWVYLWQLSALMTGWLQ